jgi:hypothetical protein
MSEQGQLLDRRTVPAFAFDPRPGNRYRTPAIGERDHQQLMMKADPGPVHDQADGTMLSLTLQQSFSERIIPFAYIDRTKQQASQALHFAGKFGTPRNLIRDQAEMHFAAQIDADEQPSEIVNERVPCFGAQLSNPVKPSMI